ncbi:hypothetical protein [Rossellomorea marisflavi]|uniref:hypothetical protein n=1 Tax=Rossellomorea marisflavi TaxID=189381 RepID=UPI003F9FF974
MISGLFHFLGKHKRKIAVLMIAYLLYGASQMEYYDMGGLIIHILVNGIVFVFVAEKVVKYADTFLTRKRNAKTNP